MSTRKVWSIAVLCLVVGLALTFVLGESVGSARFVGPVAGMLLMTVPIGLAVNVTARRRRSRRREDSPDSVEFQAAQAARSGAFGDALLLTVLAMLGLTLAPGALPMLWVLLLVVALLAAFWVRYLRALGQLRG